MKLRKSIPILLLAIFGASLIVIPTALADHTAGSETFTFLGKDLGCYPEHAPADGGCGIPAFVNALKIAINFLTLGIAIPVAVGMLIWGGVAMLLAGGSPERVSRAKSFIRVAIIGLAIALGALLIINAVFLAFTGQEANEAIQNQLKP